MIAATSAHLGSNPCLVLTHADADYAAMAARAFRRQGWDVYSANSGPQARRLARMLRPSLVVLQADLPGESGWLTCAKFTVEQPSLPVLLVASQPGQLEEEYAQFAGAEGVVALENGPNALVAQVPQLALS